MHYGPRTKLTPEAKTQPKGNVQYALDGGALLYRVPRPRGSPTYKVVCDLYCTYLQRKYGRAIVVFDGYNEMSTKAILNAAEVHIREGCFHFTFTESGSVTLKKDNFLSNPKNKQCFLSMLSKALQNVGCITPRKWWHRPSYGQNRGRVCRTSTIVLVGDEQIC